MTPPAHGAGDRVEILMAAYRGGPYIREQIESVLAQSHTGWMLRVRDDASDDDTYAVAHELAVRHPDRVLVERRATNSGSAARNFLELLETSSAPHVMLADDDDVWLPDKVAVTLAEMERIEREVGARTPVLVHTDLVVTDADLTVRQPSMVRSQRLAAGESRLPRLLVQNTVTGCTVMANRALVDLAGEPDDAIAMHDWWLAQLAAAFGRMSYLPVPTVRYRQHGRNAVGAVAAADPRYLIARALGGDETRARLRAAEQQAALLLHRHGARLSPGDRAAAEALAGLGSRGKVAAVATMARHGLWKNTLVRRLGQVWYA